MGVTFTATEVFKVSLCLQCLHSMCDLNLPSENFHFGNNYRMTKKKKKLLHIILACLRNHAATGDYGNVLPVFQNTAEHKWL